MDISAFKTSDWLKVGGGAGMFVFGLFGWASYAGYSGLNAFDFFFRGTIPWLLVVATGVLAFLVAAKMIKADMAPWPLIFLAATALGTLLVFLLLLMGPSKSTPFGDVEFDRGFGLFLSFISSAVALAGSVLGFKESGGDLNDLKDINKIKAAFDQGDGGSTPPPPPPTGGATPPPPPPPPAPPAPPAPPSA